MAGRLLRALAAAGRARSAAVATGRQRCPLPRQPLGLGSRAVRPSSLVPAFSTNAVEGAGGAAIAGGKAAWRFKTADISMGEGQAKACAQQEWVKEFDQLKETARQSLVEFTSAVEDFRKVNNACAMVIAAIPLMMMYGGKYLL